MPWTVIGQSVMGTGHERRSQPCQDAWAWKEINGDHLCVAVADGAGSASHSEVGARTAVATAIERVAQIITERTEGNTAPYNSSTQLELEQWRSPLTQVLEGVQKELKLTAQQKEISLRDLACTLLIMLWTPQGIVALQVGDGAIIGRDHDGQMVALTQPQQGEYANQTLFVVEDRAMDQAQFVHCPLTGDRHLSHVALFSDGLQRLALELPRGKPFSPFFDPLFSFLDQVNDAWSNATDPKGVLNNAAHTLENFLRSPRVTARTDDDLTLVLLAPTIDISKSPTEK
ncbi:MAG: PP2C family serine/threonine-protein phosphatase [Cyanobacteria bacterium P01_F01_bin.153]